MMYPFCAKNEMEILVSPINQIDITKQCRYNRTFLCSTFTRLIRLAPLFSGLQGQQQGAFAYFDICSFEANEGRCIF